MYMAAPFVRGHICQTRDGQAVQTYNEVGLATV